MPTATPPDFTYRTSTDGLFVSLLPESPAAVAIWNDQIAPQTGGRGKIFAPHWPQVLEQLRAAGYSVRKASSRASKMSDAKLLAALAE
jgi:hypothetical protein